MGASPPALTLGQRARRALDQLVAYLPVLLMGALAMLTYWLVRHTPELVAVQETRAANHVPDYFMRDFSLKVYTPDGRLEFRVQGEHAQHFPDTDTLEVIRPRLTKLDEAGRVTDATAQQAITTPEGQRVELKGQVMVQRAPPWSYAATTCSSTSSAIACEPINPLKCGVALTAFQPMRWTMTMNKA
jgi:lipopolysaccharide export system protein LptC